MNSASDQPSGSDTLLLAQMAGGLVSDPNALAAEVVRICCPQRVLLVGHGAGALLPSFQALHIPTEWHHDAPPHGPDCPLLAPGVLVVSVMSEHPPAEDLHLLLPPDAAGTLLLLGTNGLSGAARSELIFQWLLAAQKRNYAPHFEFGRESLRLDAILLRRRDQPPHADYLSLFLEGMRLRQELSPARDRPLAGDVALIDALPVPTSAQHQDLLAELDHLRSEIGEIDARVAALYDSRIWRSFCWAGGLLLNAWRPSRKTRPDSHAGEVRLKDYKKIWNGLSTTLDDAAFYVCGLRDEDQIRRNGALAAAFLRSALQISSSHRVLEIGCGIGRVGRELAPYCREWHGVDISGSMIAHAKRRLTDLPNAFLYELEGCDLHPFADREFDCVYATIVFMHLDKIDVFNYIAEAFRVLRVGGKACFDTYNLLSRSGWTQFEALARRYRAQPRPGHISQFSTPSEMQKYALEAGFRDLEMMAGNPELVTLLAYRRD